MRIKLSAILRKLPKKRLLISLALAVLLVVADYITANFTFPILNSADDYHITAFLSSLWAKRERDNSFDSIFCVNMAMEKELVDIADDFGDPMGNAAVTRRGMLDTVVNLAREASAANILMDIRFSEGLKSPGDSALFADIMKTDGLVVSRHRESDFGETPAAIMPKTAMSDYRGLAGSGFSRYEYLQDDQPSVAAAIWRYTSGHEIPATVYSISTMAVYVTTVHSSRFRQRRPQVSPTTGTSSFPICALNSSEPTHPMS